MVLPLSYINSHELAQLQWCSQTIFTRPTAATDRKVKKKGNGNGSSVPKIQLSLTHLKHLLSNEHSPQDLVQINKTQSNEPVNTLASGWIPSIHCEVPPLTQWAVGVGSLKWNTHGHLAFHMGRVLAEASNDTCHFTSLSPNTLPNLGGTYHTSTILF